MKHSCNQQQEPFATLLLIKESSHSSTDRPANLHHATSLVLARRPSRPLVGEIRPPLRVPGPISNM